MKKISGKSLKWVIVVVVLFILGSIFSPDSKDKTEGSKVASEKVTQEKTQDGTSKAEAPIEEKWSKELCQKNAEEFPARPGAVLATKGEKQFTGMPYYFKGELLLQGEHEAFNGKTVWLVKNDLGYVMPIEMPQGERAVEGDTVEVWGNLSGEGYSMPNVDNVVGETGYLLCTQYSVNGEQKI